MNENDKSEAVSMLRDMKSRMIERYSAGYDNGFEDCKASIIDILTAASSITGDDVISIDILINVIKNMSYHVRV